MTAPRPRLGLGARIGLVAGAMGVVAVLGVARWLEPDPRGFGTHTQLGLSPCVFREATGENCPSCGMTTAFAFVARGRLGRAWRANPAGSVLAVASPAMVAWMLASAVSARPRWSQTVQGPIVGSILAAVALAVLAWTYRILREGRG